MLAARLLVLALAPACASPDAHESLGGAGSESGSESGDSSGSESGSESGDSSGDESGSESGDEAPVEFWLPLVCGSEAEVGQGNFSDFSHQGLASHAFDILVALDTPVVAMAPGVVAELRDETRPGDPCHEGGDESCFDFANLVVLRHRDGTLTLYKHLNEVLVVEGAQVERGALLGRSGSTGWSTRPHLHVARMEDCGDNDCQSIALEFVEAGVPATGDIVTTAPCP